MQINSINNEFITLNNLNIQKTKMKKIIFSLISLAAVVSSCGVSSQAPKTANDTVAYAVGVIVGQNAKFGIDSTINPDVISSAVASYFSNPKSADKRLKELQAEMMGLQFGESAYLQIDSTMNPAVIAAGIEDVLSNKAGIQPEEASTFINNAIQGKQVDEAAGLVDEANAYLADVDAIDGVKQTATGLRYLIEEQGTGKLDSSSNVKVHYTLFDYDDNTLDSSVDRGETLAVQLPSGVVPGFAEGLMLLGKGGKATIWMPAALGYGQQGQGSVKPNQALKFEIEIVEIVK